MIKNFKKHFRYYLTFAFVNMLGFVLILLSAGSRQLQLIAILGTTLFYFIFAVMHQYKEHELNAKIVVEYALMGCVGLIFSLIAFNK